MPGITRNSEVEEGQVENEKNIYVLRCFSKSVLTHLLSAACDFGNGRCKNARETILVGGGEL